MITSLYRQISNFSPGNAQETQDQKVMLSYIQTFDDILIRDNPFAHMCSSPWIINQDATKVLMVYHNIYDSWSWCGGHCDGEADLQAVALREGLEETGIRKLKLVHPEILALDILPVPPHTKYGTFISAHVHLNATFLYQADDALPLFIKPDEHSAVKWIPIEDIINEVKEKDMMVVYDKLLKKMKSYV